MTTPMRSRMMCAAAFAAALLVFGGCGTEESTARREAPEQERVFAMLDEYGSWIDIPEFGSVWRPRVSMDWRPYAYGHWEWTDRGWMWIGYEPFAWVVYHYGSWFDDREFGWVWVPSYDWAPARVSWITADEYTCWAPLPPPGRIVPLPGEPYWEQTWVVVPSTQFTQENIVRYNVTQDSRNIGRVRAGIQRPPDVREVARSGEPAVVPVRVETDRIQSGGRELSRLRLPAQEERKIRSHDAEVQPLIRRRAADTGPERGREPGLNQETPPPVVTPAKPPADNTSPAAVPDKTRPKPTDAIQPAPKPAPDVKVRRSEEEKQVSKPPAKTRAHTPSAEKQPKVKKEGKPSKTKEKEKDR